jgi:hypothetical protein
VSLWLASYYSDKEKDMNEEYESWIWEYWQKMKNSSDIDDMQDERIIAIILISSEEVAAFNSLLGDIEIDL